MCKLFAQTAVLWILMCLGPVAFAPAQQAALGLIDGSILFLDEDSDSRCAAVNTFNADFFIRSCDRRLILITADDRETPFVVDEGFNVSSDDGSPAGRIRFATDNDGLRQVFWLSDENFPEGPDFVISYISATDQLSVATVAGQDGEAIPLQPVNISQTQCDPFATFDGGTELLCPRTCGVLGTAPLLACTMLVGLRLRSPRRNKSGA